MRLHRYLARVVAVMTLLVLVGLVMLVVAVTLVESAGELSEVRGAAMIALMLSLYSAVQYGYQVLPIACFLGALVAGSVLARHGELMAAQAAGVSSVRLAVPFLFVAMVFAAGGAACGEVAVPWAVRGVEKLQRDDLRSTSALSRFYNRRVQWFREGELLLYLPEVDATDGSFPRVVVYRFGQGEIREVIEAARLTHDENGWWLLDATSRQSGMVSEHPRLQLPLSVTPEDLTDVTGDPRELSRGEIRLLIERRARAGFDTTAHSIELNNRTALPLSALWMFLLVAPWALHPNRRRSVAVTLGGGVITIALLLATIHVFRILALGHKLPPSLGAYGAGLLALTLLPASFLLYRRFRVRGGLF